MLSYRCGIKAQRGNITFPRSHSHQEAFGMWAPTSTWLQVSRAFLYLTPSAYVYLTNTSTDSITTWKFSLVCTVFVCLVSAFFPGVGASFPPDILSVSLKGVIKPKPLFGIEELQFGVHRFQQQSKCVPLGQKSRVFKAKRESLYVLLTKDFDGRWWQKADLDWGGWCARQSLSGLCSKVQVFARCP